MSRAAPPVVDTAKSGSAASEEAAEPVEYTGCPRGRERARSHTPINPGHLCAGPSTRRRAITTTRMRTGQLQRLGRRQATAVGGRPFVSQTQEEGRH